MNEKKIRELLKKEYGDTVFEGQLISFARENDALFSFEFSELTEQGDGSAFTLVHVYVDGHCIILDWDWTSGCSEMDIDLAMQTLRNLEDKALRVEQLFNRSNRVGTITMKDGFQFEEITFEQAKILLNVITIYEIEQDKDIEHQVENLKDLDESLVYGIEKT